MIPFLLGVAVGGTVGAVVMALLVASPEPKARVSETPDDDPRDDGETA